MKISSLTDLKKLSKDIKNKLLPGDFIFLYGEIGVGKTTFARFLINNFEKLVEVEELAELGYTFADVAGDMFSMMAWLNGWLLAITVIFALGWTVGSHFLNVDAPGKAKLYAIHWFVVSGTFIALVIFTNLLIMEMLTTFPAAQDITGGGSGVITVYTTAYYTLAYYVSVLLGTARYVRSSVFLANKLPGNI